MQISHINSRIFVGLNLYYNSIEFRYTYPRNTICNKIVYWFGCKIFNFTIKLFLVGIL